MVNHYLFLSIYPYSMCDVCHYSKTPFCTQTCVLWFLLVKTHLMVPLHCQLELGPKSLQIVEGKSCTFYIWKLLSLEFNVASIWRMSMDLKEILLWLHWEWGRKEMELEKTCCVVSRNMLSLCHWNQFC